MNKSELLREARKTATSSQRVAVARERVCEINFTRTGKGHYIFLARFPKKVSDRIRLTRRNSDENNLSIFLRPLTKGGREERREEGPRPFLRGDVHALTV